MNDEDDYCHGTCPLHCGGAIPEAYGPMTREQDARIAKLSEVVAGWPVRRDETSLRVSHRRCWETRT